jgi:metallo-beta-lactamase family protein
VLHHLKLFAPDPANTILFGGFQAGGTRGAAMVGGAERIRIHGEAVQIRATVRQLESLSAHADCDQLIAWLRAARTRPRHVYITHGEVAASESLRVRIQEELGWSASVPEYRDAVEV